MAKMGLNQLTAPTQGRKNRDEMKSYSGICDEVLGVSASELTGYSVEEIAEMIRRVQAGTQDGEMSEEEIQEAAETIYKEANQ